MTNRVVDVGIPSSKFQQWESKSKPNNNNEWEKTEVRFHDFAIISFEEESPKFSCLGHTWRLMLIVGEHYDFEQNASGCVGLFLENTSNTSNTSISIDYSFSIKSSKNKVLRRIKPDRLYDIDGKRVDNATFTERQPSWGIYNICAHFFMKHFYLVKGALRVEVKMKLTEPRQLTNELETLPSSGVEDCPICMEPISKPWGVVTPCGHPFHRSCWDEVAARLLESDDDAQLSCAVCRKASTGFQPVFLDLGSTGGSVLTDEERNDEVEGYYPGSSPLSTSTSIRSSELEVNASLSLSSSEVSIIEHESESVAGSRSRRSLLQSFLRRRR